MKILCVGQIAADVLLWPVEKLDFCVDTTRIEGVKLSCGGDCLNTATTLKKLGCAPTVVSLVGQDTFGQFLRTSIAELGMPTEGIVTHPTAPTTVAIVVINAKGERVFYYQPGACDELDFRYVPMAELEKSQMVHIGGFFQLKNLDGVQAEKLMKCAKEQGKITSMDVTWASMGNWNTIQRVLPYLDYFMPSWNEAKEITAENEPEKIAAKLRQMGVKKVVLKLGAKGGYADTGEEQFFFSAFDVPVVDTTGAGDSFVAGMLAGIARGWPLRHCTRYASAVSAFCIQTLGASSGAPTHAEVESFLTQQAAQGH